MIYKNIQLQYNIYIYTNIVAMIYIYMNLPDQTLMLISDYPVRQVRIASAVFHLGDHVQKNRRMGGALSEEDCNKICETIEQLNILCLCHKIELLAVGRSFHVSLTRRYLDFIVINVNVPCDAPVFILEGERQCAQMLANHPRFTEHSGKGQKADTCDLDGCSMLLQLF